MIKMSWKILLSTIIIESLAAALASKYVQYQVDAEISTVGIFPALSILDCVIHCEASDSCSVVMLDQEGKLCQSLDKDNITWRNPTITVYVDTTGDSFSHIYFYHSLIMY